MPRQPVRPDADIERIIEEYGDMLLYYSEGYCVDEIAQLTDLSAAAVKKRLAWG